MSPKFPRVFQFLLIAALSLSLAIPSHLFAQDHVVSSADLQKQLQSMAAARQKYVAELDNLFASAQGRRAMATLHVSYQQIQKAVASLDDADLARLSAQAQKAQNDFAAGRFSNRDLIILILGVLVIILIIVAVR